MATQHTTSATPAGERAPVRKSQQGPVTQAIAVMRQEPEPPRRGFLRGLASLPLIGAGIALPALSNGAAFSPAKSELAKACEFAITHGHWIDEVSFGEYWDDERLNDEMDKCNAAFDRALVEQSQGLEDLKAKARLCLDDRERFSPEAECDPGERLVYVVLRELISL